MGREGGPEAEFGESLRNGVDIWSILRLGGMNKQESWLPSSEGKKSEIFSFIYLPPEEQYQLLPPLFAETHVHLPPPSFWGVWGADGGDGEWWGGGEDAAQDWLVLSFLLRPGGGAQNWKRSLVVGTGCPGGRWGGHKKDVNSFSRTVQEVGKWWGKVRQ